MALCYNEQLLDLEQYYDAIAYYRLSRYDGMKHESNSIANQRKLVRAYLQNTPIFTWSRKRRMMAIPGRITTAPVLSVSWKQSSQSESIA